MSDMAKVVLAALGVLTALSVIVSAVLRHHIGGFIEKVAREEEERAEEDRADEARTRPDSSPEDRSTGDEGQNAQEKQL